MKPKRSNPLFAGFFRKNLLATSVVLSFGLGATVGAQTLYWDTDGANPGLAGGNGTWDTDTFWSGSLDGDSLTSTWADGNIARFHAAGPYTVTISGTVDTPEIRFPSSATGLHTITGGSIDLTGGLQLNTTGVPDASGNSKTINSTITGTGNLTFVGNGDLSDTGGGSDTRVNILGTNDFTGTINLNDGLYSFTSDANFGNAANVLNFNGGGILMTTAGTLNLPRNLTMAGNGVIRTYGSSIINHTGTITGPSGTNLRKTDGGTLYLAGDGSAFNGTFTIGAGTVRLDTANWANTDFVQTDNGNILRLIVAGDTTIKSLVSDRDIVVPFGSRLNIANGTYTTVGAGTTYNPFWAQGTTAGDAAATGEITSASGTLNITNGAATGSLTTTDNRIRLKITDFGSGLNPTLLVVKNNQNSMIFDMANTYTGGTTINGGRINADNLSAFGAGTVTVNTGGQAYLTQGGAYLNNFVINGIGVNEGAGDLGAVRFGGSTVSGSINVATDSRISAYSSTGTHSGALTGSGNLEIGVTGNNGTMNFTGNTSGYLGTMSLAAGTLNVGALGGGLTVAAGTANLTGAVAGTTTLAPGAVLNLNSGAQTGSPVLSTGATRTLNINAGSTVSGDVVTDLAAPNAADVNLAGTITGNAVIDDTSTLGLRGGSIGGNLTSGFDTNSNITWNLTSPVDVTGNVTINGAVTVNLLANPLPGETATVLTYDGTFTGNIANFAVSNPTLYRSPIFTNTGSAITLNTGSGSRIWAGNNGTNPTFWDATTVNWTGGDGKFFNGDAVLFNDDAVGTAADMQAVLLPYSVTFNNTTKDFTIGGAGSISGTTGITKNGTGTVTLGGANGQNYTGAVAVNAGVLALGSRDALGQTSGVTVAAGARVNLNGQSPGSVATGGHTWTIRGDGGDGAGGVGAITNTGGPLYGSSGVKSLVLADHAEIGGSGTGDGNGRFDVGINAGGGGAGTINGGGFTLTKVGSNQMVFRAPATNITYVVNQGRLTFEDFNTASGTNDITVNNSGSALGTYGARTIANNVVLNSGTTLVNVGGGDGTWSGSIALNGNNTLDAPGNQLILSGTATQTGAVAKTGGNQLTITGTYNLNGGTFNHNAGTVQVGNVGATGAFSGTGTVNLGNGVLFRNRLSGANNTIAANFSFANGSSELRQHSGLTTDTLTLTGTIGTNTANGILRTTFGRLTLGSGASATVNQVAMQGAPATGRSVINVATGASLTSPWFNIGQDSSNSGILNVTGGTVTAVTGSNGVRIGHWNNNNSTFASELNVSGGLYDGSAANLTTNIGWDGYGIMTVGGGASTATAKAWRLQMDANGDSTTYNCTATILPNGVLEIGAGGTASPSANDYIVLNGGRMIATGNSNWAARVDVAGLSEIGAATGTQATQTGSLTGSANLTKVGAGEFRFGTFGTWTGDLTVAEGTLVASGTVPGDTTVNNGATVSMGSTFAVGNVATATFGDSGTTTTIDGRFTFDLNATDITAGGTTNDLVSIPGNVTFNANSKIRPSFYGGTLVSGNRYSLFQVDGTRTGLPVVDPEIVSSVRFTLSVVPGETYPSDVELLVSGTTGNLIWAGDGTGNAWDINSAQNWTLDTSPAKFLNYDNVSFTDAGNNAAPVTLTGNLLPSSVTVNATKDYVWAGTGTIGGSTGLAKDGTGKLTVTTTNAFAGTIAISGGTVAVGNGGTTGDLGATGGAASVALGATLEFNRSNAQTFSRATTGEGTLRKLGSGALTFSTGGAGALPTNVVVDGGTLQISGGGFSIDRLQGNGLVTVNPTGTLLLSGTAHPLGGDNGTMTESVVVNGGTMTVNNEQYFRILTLNGATVNGTNELRATSTATNWTVTGSTPSTVSARVSMVGNANWNVEDVTGSTAADLTLSGAQTNTGSLVKNGAGTLLLTGQRSFTGALTLNAGVVAIGGTGNPAVSQNLAGTGGTLRNDSTGTLTLSAASAAFGGVVDTNAKSLNIAQSFGGAASVIRLAGTPLNIGVGALSFAAVAGDQTSDVPVTTTSINGDFSSLHNTAGNVVPGTTTHVFRGRVLLQGGTQYSFAKNFDDGMWVKVGDTVVINDDTWNNVATGSFTPATTGWYDIDVRAYQGGGGVGPQGDWATAGIGLGIRVGAPTLVPADYQPFGNGAAGITLAADTTADTIGGGILLTGGTSSTVNTAVSAATIAGAITSSANEGLVKTGAEDLILAGANTYSGNTNVSAGELILASTGQLRFVPTTNGVSNKVTGLGTATFAGTFVIDTSGANTTNGNSWVLVDAASSSYDTSFAVSGFADPENDGTWVRNEGGNAWTFNEATGILSVAVVAGYDAWATQIGDENQRDRADDPDGDGFTNLQEFLFGTSPIANNGSLTTTERTSPTTLVIRWNERVTGADYTLLESATLANPWSVSGAPVTTDGTPVGDYQPMKATVTIGAGKNFFRVEGTEN